MITQLSASSGAVVTAPETTKKQGATSSTGGDASFHHVLRVAGDTLAAPVVAGSAYSADNSTMPSMPAEETIESSSATAEHDSDAVLSNSMIDPNAKSSLIGGECMPDAPLDSMTQVAAPHVAGAAPCVPPKHASTGKTLERPKCNTDEDASGAMSAMPPEEAAIGLVQPSAPFALPASVATPIRLSIGVDAPAIGIHSKSNAGSDVMTSTDVTPSIPDEGTKAIADAFSGDVPAAFEKDVAVKDSKHANDFRANGAGDHVAQGKSETPGAMLSAQIVPSTEQGVVFRSSFLHHSAANPDFAGQMNEAMDMSAETSSLPTSAGAVKHLEVSLKDAGLGETSVRAEMKDGMLHASVLTGHADAFLTASALHRFLERNQVPVHAVNVESWGTTGLQKTVSTSSVASGSFSGDSRGGDQGERARSMRPGSATSLQATEREGWSQINTASAGAAAHRQYQDGRSLSIHI